MTCNAYFYLYKCTCLIYFYFRTLFYDWTEKFAFIEKENKPICLICNKELAQNKSGNIKRHYETKHINFSKEYPLNSDYRKNKIELEMGVQ